MYNESISRLVGSLVGAAVIIAGLAAFGPGVSRAHDAVSQSLATPVAVFHASETITVSGN